MFRSMPKVHTIGEVMSCERDSHVQSWATMVDQHALPYYSQRYWKTCYHERKWTEGVRSWEVEKQEAISQGEIGPGLDIMQHGWELATVWPKFQMSNSTRLCIRCHLFRIRNTCPDPGLQKGYVEHLGKEINYPTQAECAAATCSQDQAHAWLYKLRLCLNPLNLCPLKQPISGVPTLNAWAHESTFRKFGGDVWFHLPYWYKDSVHNATKRALARSHLPKLSRNYVESGVCVDVDPHSFLGLNGRPWPVLDRSQQWLEDRDEEFVNRIKAAEQAAEDACSAEVKQGESAAAGIVIVGTLAILGMLY